MTRWPSLARRLSAAAGVVGASSLLLSRERKSITSSSSGGNQDRLRTDLAESSPLPGRGLPGNGAVGESRE